ncbi:MAG: hypothetical protein J5649_10475 [Lachnospiraceae bacterium]|nr:hypothetical protein [Lachnospiraceae bacterium]
MDNKEKKDNPFFIALICVLLLGPIIAGTILLSTDHLLAGLLVFVIPYSCLVLWGFLRKYKLKRDFYKIKDAGARFDIVPIDDEETLKALCEGSAITFFGEPSKQGLDMLYNWLNNEGVLKTERLNLYTFSGKDLKNAFGKRKKFDEENKFMSISLKDLDLTDANTRQFSLDRVSIGGRWLDDIVSNG